jgi:hypothetical protein
MMPMLTDRLNDNHCSLPLPTLLGLLPALPAKHVMLSSTWITLY